MIHVRTGARRLAAVALLSLALVAPALLPTLPARADDGRAIGRLDTREGVSVLVLEGSPRERGRQQGRALAKPIVQSIVELQGVIRFRFKAAERHQELLSRFTWPAEVQEELDGIVEGVKEKLGDAEVPGLGRSLARADLEGLNTIADLLPFGCSSFTISGDRVADGGTITGRNLDYPVIGSILESKLVIVRAASGASHGWATVGWPGVVGCYTGINDEGVTASIHDVPVGKGHIGEKGFVPRTLGVRAILEKIAPSEGWIDRAAAVLRKTPVIYGNNIHVSAPHAKGKIPAAILEWGPEREQEGGVTVRLSGEGEPALVCTNHWRSRKEPIHCRRYGALTRALEAAGPRWTAASAMETLRVSNVSGATLTIHSVVFALEARTMHVAFASSKDRGAAYETTLSVNVGDLLDQTRLARPAEPELVPAGPPRGKKWM